MIVRFLKENKLCFQITLMFIVNYRSVIIYGFVVMKSIKRLGVGSDIDIRVGRGEFPFNLLNLFILLKALLSLCD